MRTFSYRLWTSGVLCLSLVIYDNPVFLCKKNAILNGQVKQVHFVHIKNATWKYREIFLKRELCEIFNDDTGTWTSINIIDSTSVPNQMSWLFEFEPVCLGTKINDQTIPILSLVFPLNETRRNEDDFSLGCLPRFIPSFPMIVDQMTRNWMCHQPWSWADSWWKND